MQWPRMWVEVYTKIMLKQDEIPMKDFGVNKLFRDDPGGLHGLVRALPGVTTRHRVEKAPSKTDCGIRCFEAMIASRRAERHPGPLPCLSHRKTYP